MKNPLLRVAGLLCLIAGPAAANLYVPGGDFSLASNPNGVWQYGYTASLGGPITLLPASTTVGGFELWYGVYDIGVGYNPTVANAGSCGSCSIPSGYAGFSPGYNGDYGVFRFTAPVDGTYDLDFTFQGGDYDGPTSSDVNVVHNTTVLFSSFINGYGPSSAVSYSHSEYLAAGDTLDLAAGWGNNSNYGWDTTAFTGSITGGPTTPEPATTSLIGGAGLLLAAYTKRKRARV
jgi:hypothetical protein